MPNDKETSQALLLREIRLKPAIGDIPIAARYWSGTHKIAGESPSAPPSDLSFEEARAIARDAVVFGFPLVENYRIQHSYFVDGAGPHRKAPYNRFCNLSDSGQPDGKAILAPDTDMRCSWIGLDLRAEPIVLSIPSIPAGRYWSAQLVDLYTFNFDYLGSRATGNSGGNFAIAGPNWLGVMPRGIRKVIICETEIATALFRTQLFGPDDIENVRTIQSRYNAQPLSVFAGDGVSPGAPPIQYPPPLPPEKNNAPEFFQLLNFLLQFCPVHHSEIGLRARLEKLGIAPGKPFEVLKFAPDIRLAIERGMTDAWNSLAEFIRTQIDTGRLSSGDAFGTRTFLRNDYMLRMAAAVMGLFRNSGLEEICPFYFTDAGGRKLEGTGRYRIHFARRQSPPVNALWSLTLYELPSNLPYANPLGRHRINSTMRDELIYDEDGGLTLDIQHASPGPERQANWLPCPQGPFSLALRLYWPQPEAQDKDWIPPPLERLE